MLIRPRRLRDLAAIRIWKEFKPHPMDTKFQQWFLCRCQHCNGQIKFQFEKHGDSGPCPYCKKETVFNPNSASKRRILPSWTLIWMAILTVTVIAGIGIYQFGRHVGIDATGTIPFLLWCIVVLLSAACSVLWILFHVYVFNSLREIRSTLKEIEINTRAQSLIPKLQTHGAESPLPSTKPGPPPEHSKYMPKT